DEIEVAAAEGVGGEGRDADAAQALAAGAAELVGGGLDPEGRGRGAEVAPAGAEVERAQPRRRAPAERDEEEGVLQELRRPPRRELARALGERGGRIAPDVVDLAEEGGVRHLALVDEAAGAAADEDVA